MALPPDVQLVHQLEADMIGLRPTYRSQARVRLQTRTVHWFPGQEVSALSNSAGLFRPDEDKTSMRQKLKQELAVSTTLSKYGCSRQKALELTVLVLASRSWLLFCSLSYDHSQCF